MKAKNFLKSFFCYVFSILFIISSGYIAPAYAEVKLPTGREDEFAENNIVFYNPDGRSTKRCRSRVGSGECNFIGDTYTKRMWSGLRNLGFTPEQTAGLMGNFNHEGGTPVRQEDSYITARDNNCKTEEGKTYTIWLDNVSDYPATHDSCIPVYKKGEKVSGIGLGFAQWTSHDKRMGYLDRIQAAGLIDYFDGDAYKVYGKLSDDQFRQKVIDETGSDDEWSALWCIALGYIYDIFSTDSGFLSQSSPEDVAGWVSANYEKCKTCDVGDTGWSDRRDTAKILYDQYVAGDFDDVESLVGTTPSSDGSSSSSSGSSSETGSNITLIGDSISVGAQSEIQAIFPDLTDFDAKTGRRFDEGVTLADTKELKDIVIFALGSNGGATEDQLNKLLARASGSTVILVTNYSREKLDFTANNALFKSAASNHSNVVLADWEAAVSSDPEKYVRVDPDGVDVHPTIGEGTKKFAEVLADAIKHGGSGSSHDPDCYDTSIGGKLVDGGFSSVEEANNSVMKPYRDIPNRSYSSGYPSTQTEGDKLLASYHIANVGSSCVSDLENCPAFVAYFITKYVPGVNIGGGLPNGGEVADYLINNYGFEDLGGTPAVYSVFSVKTHTGIVLGINTTTDTIIIGEAGCGMEYSWTAAHTYKLSDWTGNGHKYAYREVNLN